MPRTVTLFAVAALLFAATPCMAQKIALVNVKEVIFTCDEGAKAVAALHSEFDPRRQALEAKKQELAALQKEIQEKGLEKSGKKGEMESKLAAYAREENQFRQELAAREEASLKPIAEKVGAAIKAYGAEKNFAGIQDRGLYLYFDPTLDVTAEILKRVNQGR